MLFGTTGTAQALGPPGASALAIGAVRLALGGMALVAVAFFFRPPQKRAWLRHAPALLMGGAAVAVYQLGWFAGLRRTGVALGTVVGIGSGPVMAGVLHLLRRRGRLTRAWLLGTAATIAGAGLLAARGAGEGAVDALGLLLTLGAVLGYVLSVEAAQHAMARGLDPAGAMAGIFGAGALLLAPVLCLEPLAWVATARGRGHGAAPGPGHARPGLQPLRLGAAGPGRADGGDADPGRAAHRRHPGDARSWASGWARPAGWVRR